MRNRLHFAALLTAALLTFLAVASGKAADSPIEPLPHLPLSFEQNGDGFLAHGAGYSIWLDSSGASIHSPAKSPVPSTADVSLHFAGASHASATPELPLPGKVSYILGNDPAKWKTGLPTWKQVHYSGIYPGIDVVYYGRQQQLEFDLVLKPGADPRGIRMKIDGASGLSVDRSGSLLIGGVMIELPGIYQTIGGRQREVRGRFVLRGKDEAGIELGRYDRKKTLVIDPTIVYSALMSGGGGSITSNAIAVDSSGNTIIAGSIGGYDLPTVNAAQNVSGNGTDVFISKINAAGDTLLYSTYLGGSITDIANAIAVDSTGSAWITGSTISSNFPLLNAAQSTGGFNSAFVARINSAGALQFSTYLGGGGSIGTAVGRSIAVDGNGNGFVTGDAGSPGYFTFPTTSGTLATGSAFVVKYGPSGSIIYSALLGGAGSDSGRGIAVDSSGNAYVTGVSSSPVFNAAPSGGAHPTNNASANNFDVFVAKLNATATNLLYFTFLGGTSTSSATGIAIDATGKAWITGSTRTPGLATAATGQTSIAGGIDGFVAQLNPAGSAFNWLTYLGGARLDSILDIALDGSGNAYVTGKTASGDFPSIQAVQPAFPGNSIALLRSTDSGTSWTSWDAHLPGATADISVNPSGASALAVTDSGIYRSTDGGISWSLQSTYAFGVVSGSTLQRSPTNANTIYTFSGGQILTSKDDGVTWNLQSSQISSLMIVDPTNASTLYSWGHFGTPVVQKSTNGGLSFFEADSGLPYAAARAMVATSDGTLYVAFIGGIYRSTDHATTWTSVNSGITNLAAIVGNTSLTASGNTVYLTGDQFYRLTAGSSTWSGTGNVISPPILASPQNASVVYALGGDNTMRVSTDGGNTWNSGQALPTDLVYATTRIAADASSASNLYIAASVNNSGFVTKLNSSGQFVWSSFLGNPAGNSANGVTLDTNGNALVTGTANSGFPITTTALPSAVASGSPPTSAFIARIADATAACSLQVMPGDQIIPAAGGTVAFSVVAPSGCAWTASASQTWVAIAEGSSGTGSASMVLRFPANTGNNRTAVVTIGSKTINITQAGATCVNTTDQSTYLVPSNGASVSIVMTTGASCPWKVAYPSPTVTLTSAATGTGSATVTVQVAANLSNFSQTFFVYIGSAVAMLSQGIGTPPSILYPNLTGTAGVPFPSTTLSATGGSPPYGLWAIASGALPPGLTLDSVTGTISGTPTSSAGSPYMYSPTVQDANHNTSIPVSFAFVINPGTTITAIHNAADLSSAPLAPGSLAQLTGTLLATSSATAPAGAAPFTLGGAAVSVNGTAAAILSASITRIVFQVPYETAAGTATVTAVANGSTSNAVQFGVVAAAPGVISVLNNSAGSPAVPGGSATIYYTGAGAQNPPVADGAAGPASAPFPAPVLPATVTIGGNNAPVSSQSLVAGLVGYSQATVQTPTGLIAGAYSVVITANGKSSQPGNIYVQGAAPTVTGVAPNSAPLGNAAVSVSVTGSNFGSGSALQWTPAGGTATTITPTAIQPTQITASIPASLLVSAETAQIAVINGLGVASGPVTFHVVPVITSVSPSRVQAGSGATVVTIVGQGLLAGNTLSFTPPGGTATSIVLSAIQSTQVTATIPAAALTTGGTAELAVADSTGGLSNLLPLTITGAPGAVTVTLTTSAASSILGQPVTFTATVAPAAATGKVTFYAATTVLGTRTLAGGTAVFTTALLPAGSQVVQARYSGDNTYGAAVSAAMTQKVTTLPSNGWAAPVGYISNSYAGCIATGDFDGDGKQDLVSCAAVLLKGNGDGTFQSPIGIPLNASMTQLLVADFDGDGKQDLAAVTPQGIYILPGNGDGTFATPRLQATTSASGVTTQSAIVADFNLDGIADLVASNSDGSMVSFLGVGDGTFRTFANFGTTFTYGNKVFMAAGDFNGDGKPDFAAPDITTTGFRIFLGNGDGSFQAPLVHAGNQTFNIPYQSTILTQDMNGDGRADLVVQGAHGLVVAYGNGDGTFTVPGGVAGGFPDVAGVTDFNGDGKLDIVANDPYSYTILLGDGAGNFPNSVSFSWGSSNHGAFVLGSFDGSGHVDSADTGNLSVWLDASVATPVATLISPAIAEVGDAATTVTLTGRNVGQGAGVLWTSPDGTQATVAPPSPTSGSITPGQITVTAPATLLAKAGTAKVALVNNLGGISNALPFVITPFEITGISAGTVAAGANQETITVSGPTASRAIGLLFTPPGGSPKTISVAASGPTQISATIPGEYLTVAGTAHVALIKSEGVVSNSLSLSIGQPLAVPSVVLSSSVSPSLFGKPVTLTASISPASATGKVFFYDGTAVVGGDAVVNGTASATTILLTPGSHNIVARYTGDGAVAGAGSNRVVQAVTSVPVIGFGNPGGITTGGQAVAAGDFNGDGNADLAFANNASAILTILLGNGDGTFGQPVSYNGAAGSYAGGWQPIAVADLNGDGKSDIVISDTGGNHLSVFIGKGDGTFQPVVQYTSPTVTEPNGVLVADFNRDGIPDVLMTGYSGFSFWPGTGDGTFGQAINGAPGSQGSTLTAGDFNNDGNTDFVYDFGLTEMLGNGDGTFQRSSLFSAATGVGGSALVADINKDGIPDLVVGAWVALGNGNGTFATPVPIAAAARSTPILAVDLNGDGNVDLVGVSGSDTSPSIFYGNSDGTFGPPQPLSTYYTNGLVVADFNGDGQPDLGAAYGVMLGIAGPRPAISSVSPASVPVSSGVTTVVIAGSNFAVGSQVWITSNGTTLIIPTQLQANQITASLPASSLKQAGTAQISVVRGDGLTSNSVPFYITPFQITSVTPGSVVAGGHAIVVTVAGTGLTAAVNLVLTPAGGAAVTIPLSQIQATQVTATIPAIFLRTAGSAQIALANSAGALSNPVSFTITAPLSASTLSLATSGSPSVLGQPVTLTATVSLAAATGKVTFYSGTTVVGTRAVTSGTATFVTSLLPTGTQVIRAHYSGDAANGAGNAAPVSQTVKSNVSAGLRTPAAYGSGVNVQALAVGDFNNDGVADIVTANQNTTGLSILLGDGTGAFHQSASYTVSSYPLGVRVADFNGDGNADIAVVTGSIMIFAGNGDGTFQTPYVFGALPLFSSAAYFTSLAIADVDGDGVPDVIGGQNDGTIAILAGNGDGTLSLVSSFGTVSSYFNLLPIIAADFNGDGVPDIVYAGQGIGSTMGALRTFLGNGDGTFHGPISGPAPGSWLISGDFNGDGKLDLATSFSTFPFHLGTVVALGDGDGTFTLQPALNSSGLASLNAVAADFDGDGKTDLVSGSPLTSVYGNGDGTFSRQTVNNISNEGPGLAVADFNGDGVADVVMGLNTAGVDVLLGEAGAAAVITSITPSYAVAGSSAVTVTIFGQNLGKTASVNWSQTNTIVPSQVQNNQVTATIPTSLLTYANTPQISLTDSAGVSSNALTFPVASFAITSVTPNSALAGSQAVQITIAGTNIPVSQQERLEFHLPDGTTQQLTMTNQQATQVTGIIPAAWLTKAGAASISFANLTNSNALPFTILPGLAAPSITLSSSLNPAIQSQTITLTAQVSPGTATGTVIFYDGLAAIGRGTLAGGQASVTTRLLGGGKRLITARYLGDGQNGPVASVVFNQVVAAVPSNGFLAAINYVTGYPATGITVADLNRDGTSDLVVGNAGSGNSDTISVLIGDRDGSFRAPVSYPIFGAAAAPLVADFDGDGISDVAGAVPESTGLEILKGKGDGTFPGAVPIIVSSTDSGSPGGIVADFNGDGAADMISGQSNAQLGLGDGTFASAAATTGLGLAVAAGDFDGDGKVDLVSGHSLPASLIDIFKGNGDGTFQIPIAYAADGSAVAKSITTGDFNNDGNLDFAFADGTGVWIALGKGDATFTLSTVPGAGNSPQAVVACDFDGDGEADLCIADGSTANGGAIVLRGIGDGTFRTPLMFGTGIPAIGIVAGDFNGDGQTDLALADQGVYSVTILLGAPGSQPQTIAFGALNDVAAGSAPIVLTASASSGLPVTFVSNTSTVCTVSGNTVNIVLAGGCSITASQAGNASYAAASATQAFTVMFGDTSPADHYYAAINALAQHGITAGCGNNDFCPGENVTRDQMAIFIVRSIYGNDNFVYNPTPYFTDVTPSTFGFKWIQKMKDLGITNGCTATTYCPTDTVSRDQMAVFVIRARLGLALAGGQNPTFTYPSTPYFTDVPAGAFGYQWIQRMKEEGITSGCTATDYCPSSPIIRGDMAIFIMRGAFNQFLPAGMPVVSQISPSTLALGASGTFTITGANTSWIQGTTVLSPIPGVTIGAIAVTSPTTMTVQLTAAANAVAQPYSILTVTGAEQDVLPNGLALQ